MVTTMKLFTFSIFLIHLVSPSFSLECYVCKDQEDNRGKCVKTVKTCDPLQDRCLSEVRWGGMPYWAPSGEKQYYVSKHCASEYDCSKMRAKYQSRCDRIWFNDWECVDCCHGDRCNYFVTLGSTGRLPSRWLVASSGVMALMSLGTFQFLVR